MNNNKILVVDDEDDICEILQFNLEYEGYMVDIANSGEEAIELMLQSNYSLVLLDVMMGGISGYKTAERLRKELNVSTPIIFLTAKVTENDMLTGFSVGADDYIAKPFSVKEVIARVKAVINRCYTPNQVTKECIVIDELTINLTNKNISINGNDIKLTKKEYEILVLLTNNPNNTFTREDILSKAWSDDTTVLDRTVDVHIARLRKKLGEYGNRIVNRSNYGYCFNV